MPAQVKKPKQKASVKGAVGKIARKIIGMLRNESFHSYVIAKRKSDIFGFTIWSLYF